MRCIGILVSLLLLALPATANAQAATKFKNLHTAVRERGALIEDIQQATPADQDEMLCMALNIYHEVKGLPDRDQWAVAFVTWNRTKRSVFNSKTICAAVWAPGQFSWTQWPVRAQLPRESTSWLACQKKAVVMVLGEKMNDPTNGSTHFYQARLNPGWARRLVDKIRIGTQMFARLPGSD